MDPEINLDVIAVGAHPDDCEIGCGGTLASLAASGLKVGIVDLTDGEPTPNCPDPKVRIAEANEAASKLGLAGRIILNLPNRRLFDGFEARIELAKQFRIYRPKIVLGLHGKTPTASPDHWQAMQITDAAIFYSRLSKWDEYFDGLPVHKISKQLYYSLFFESDWSGSGPRQFIYDIADTLEKKIESVRCYQTQFPPEKSYIYDRIRAMAQACGQSAGLEAGEVLTSTSSLGSRDLLHTLLLT
ncbi:MAG: PIG-L family deacetylase [Mariniblastus sp.]|nr:PIG-L family deacetylase [Mariniblastus sp.]